MQQNLIPEMFPLILFPSLFLSLILGGRSRQRQEESHESWFPVPLGPPVCCPHWVGSMCRIFLGGPLDQ